MATIAAFGLALLVRNGLLMIIALVLAAVTAAVGVGVDLFASSGAAAS